MGETEFSSYLVKKKIDPGLFKESDPGQFQKFSLLFEQIHENSFTAQKLFLLNGIRRKYPLSEIRAINPEPSVPKMRPKMKIKPKL